MLFCLFFSGSHDLFTKRQHICLWDFWCFQFLEVILTKIFQSLQKTTSKSQQYSEYSNSDLQIEPYYENVNLLHTLTQTMSTERLMFHLVRVIPKSMTAKNFCCFQLSIFVGLSLIMPRIFENTSLFQPQNTR